MVRTDAAVEAGDTLASTNAAVLCVSTVSGYRHDADLLVLAALRRVGGHKRSPTPDKHRFAGYSVMARLGLEPGTSASGRRALCDYEWLLAFEADELSPIVRPHAPPARRRGAAPHAPRAPVPDGRRRPLVDAVADLPCDTREPGHGRALFAGFESLVVSSRRRPASAATRC